ncbi:putative basic amino acid antiporter YfcC [Aerococcus sp. CDC-944-U94]|uniref:putative basic amino acid antiporter YfcC n=1 Tax=Aerococcus urinae (strain CCUG 59500 / ACS-120-V-Col10a) TaxID=2976812 RepID=UPI00227A0BFE|nr:putative basic amino acid antiporter YfcC [Aerococcus sp. Group 1]MCY3055669.1 putative basic amino acid antiporter YfcC [Aerococcus sp. Group 1]MCY3057399.1 putative basic amino acid antiporter YfcC [Aerococcus sp. Group 1]
MRKMNETAEKKQRFQTPHTYVIIFGIVLVAWLLTFIVPAGKYTTEVLEYEGANGETQTRTVLQQDSFRYMHPLKEDVLRDNLEDLVQEPAKMQELEVDQEDLSQLLEKSEPLTLGQLEEIDLEESELYAMYGDSIYDTSKNLNKTAGLWGTQDHYGFGVLNYIFEGIVTGDRYGSAIGIVALLLVVGGSFGIIMRTGAIDAGIYAFVNSAKGMEHLAIPLLFFLFSFAGATFGASEQVIPFVMIIAPFMIALGYDSITAVTVTFAASQIGNACSWMSPFSIAIVQGIAGLPALSGAGFRIVMWVIITTLSCGFTMVYAKRIRKAPQLSPSYESDAYFRTDLAKQENVSHEFTLGHKLILLEMLLGLVWIVWGVMSQGFSIPELASQFFVMGLVSGITALIFRIDGITVNDIAFAFKDGVSDLAPTAVVVGMAKGILLVLGGSDAGTFSALNTILYGVGNLLSGIPNVLGAWFMYIFQSCFNLVVTSNSGQAALTMPIMAPLADIIGVSRQVAVLAFQLGSGFVDAFTPVSASLVGCLAVARIDWADWAKFQIKMQGFLFVLGSIAIIIAISIGYS